MTDEFIRVTEREGGVKPLAEKVKLSMPKPWLLPAALAISQTSQRAAPGGQLDVTRLVRFNAAVMIAPAEPLALAPVRKETPRLGNVAVMLLTEKLFVPVGRSEEHTSEL